MKKILLFLATCILLTGCSFNNLSNDKKLKEFESINPTKSINNLKCSDLDEYDVLDVTNKYLVLSNGSIYEYINLEDKKSMYSNGEQCKKIESDMNFKFVINKDNYCCNEYFAGPENYIYYLNKNKEFERQYSKSSPYYSEYKTMYSLDEEILQYGFKYSEKYAALDNGIIYTINYLITYIPDDDSVSKDRYEIELIDKQKLELEEDYGYIYDFEMNDDGIIRLLTSKGLYELKEIETKECTTYADVECKMELALSDKLKDYNLDNIKYMDFNYVVTKNNSIISWSNFLKGE